MYTAYTMLSNFYQQLSFEFSFFFDFQMYVWMLTTIWDDKNFDLFQCSCILCRLVRVVFTGWNLVFLLQTLTCIQIFERSDTQNGQQFVCSCTRSKATTISIIYAFSSLPFEKKKWNFSEKKEGIGLRFSSLGQLWFTVIVFAFWKFEYSNLVGKSSIINDCETVYLYNDNCDTFLLSVCEKKKKHSKQLLSFLFF